MPSAAHTAMDYVLKTLTATSICPLHHLLRHVIFSLPSHLCPFNRLTFPWIFPRMFPSFVYQLSTEVEALVLCIYHILTVMIGIVCIVFFQFFPCFSI